MLYFGGLSKAQVIVNPAQDFPVRVAGRLINSVTGKAVSYGTVRNLVTKRVVIADTGGNFSIVIATVDSLEIRRVGYRTRYYTKALGRNGNYVDVIQMTEESINLQEVTIYRKRKREINSIALNPEYGRKDNFRIYLFGYQPGPRRRVEPDISSPLSFLYDQFSRSGKAARKLEELRAQSHLQSLISIRYNRDYVQELTGLSERDLSEFMAFCPMSSDFVLRSNDYELAAATLNCYRQFMNGL